MIRQEGLLAFRKAQRGHERHGLGNRRTPPPKPITDVCLLIVAESAFSSGPLESQNQFSCRLFSSNEMEMVHRKPESEDRQGG
jgi:hypothetical protein